MRSERVLASLLVLGLFLLPGLATAGDNPGSAAQAKKEGVVPQFSRAPDGDASRGDATTGGQRVSSDLRFLVRACGFRLHYRGPSSTRSAFSLRVAASARPLSEQYFGCPEGCWIDESCVNTCDLDMYDCMDACGWGEQCYIGCWQWVENVCYPTCCRC
jgi:hypothetical protein